MSTDFVIEAPGLPQPTTRRAGLVCTACHSRKTRCDVKARRGQGYSDCSSCAAAARECNLRQGKRRRGRERQRQASPVSTAGSQYSATSRAPQLEQHSEGIAPAQRDSPPPHSLPTPHSGGFSTADTANATETHGGDVDTGFIQPFRPEYHTAALLERRKASESPIANSSDHVPPRHLQIFADTYFQYCYAWCPVLDRDTVFAETARSPLLANALALAGSHTKPSLITPHPQPSTYYDRARRIFYEDEELDTILALKSLLLFYWWAPRSTSLVHRHSSWWWTSTVIRHAQQMDLHREPTSQQTLKSSSHRIVQRKIFWTAYARERLTALCQSKPPIINPDDCTVTELTAEDFPGDESHRMKGEVFIYYVRLCSILGKMASHLSRSSANSLPPHYLSSELIAWVRSLPPHLTLSIASSENTPNGFNRDVHQLHLPYLVAVIILHLKSSNEALPKVSPPAILAASCVARIFEDILARGNTRFLLPITSWYSAVSFVTLLQASYQEDLSTAANAELDIITLTINQLRKMWASSEVVYQGFKRLRPQQPEQPSNANANHQMESDLGHRATTSLNDRNAETDNVYLEGVPGIETLDFFPFVTEQTSLVAKQLLANTVSTDWHDAYQWQTDPSFLNLQDWFNLNAFDDEQFVFQPETLV